MEPLTTSAMIGGIVAYLGGKLSKDKSISTFISEFSDATINWIKPLFLKDDGSEKEAIQKLKEKPESEARQNAVKSLFEMELEDNPENAEGFIKEMFAQITKKDKEILKKINKIKVKGNDNITIVDSKFSGGINKNKANGK